jgi:hypothetical protein
MDDSITQQPWYAVQLPDGTMMKKLASRLEASASEGALA